MKRTHEQTLMEMNMQVRLTFRIISAKQVMFPSLSVCLFVLMRTVEGQISVGVDPADWNEVSFSATAHQQIDLWPVTTFNV